MPPIGRIPETMLAAQLVEYNKPYKIHKVPTPKPSDLAPHELLLKVAVASFCHTDFMVSSGIFKTKLPCIGSHEGAGIVAATGSSASSQWKLGDRVMAGLRRNACGKCPDCTGPEDERQYCPYSDGACGVNLDGAFAEYMVVDGRESAKLPDGVDFATAAPLACAGCTVYGALLQTKAKPGDWVALVGSGGGLGHIGIRMGKAMGLKIIGIDARDAGLGLTKESGADVVIDSRKGEDEVVQQVAQATGGDKGKHAGVMASIALADHAEGLACAVTAMHGLVIQVAQPENVSIPFHHIVFRDIRVKGSLHAAKTTAQDMLNMVADHKIGIEVVKYNGLKELPHLVDLVKSGELRGKAVIVVDESLK